MNLDSFDYDESSSLGTGISGKIGGVKLVLEA